MARLFPGFCFLFLAAMSLPGLAANWREVGSLPQDGITVHVDDNSLLVDHEVLVKGWVRFDYKPPREREGQVMASYTSYRMVNCETQRYWITEGWAYPPNRPEPLQVYYDSQYWRLASPDSEAEIAVAALCYETKSLFGIVWEKLSLQHNLAELWEKMRRGISNVETTGAPEPAAPEPVQANPGIPKSPPK